MMRRRCRQRSWPLNKRSRPTVTPPVIKEALSLDALECHGQATGNGQRWTPHTLNSGRR